MRRLEILLLIGAILLALLAFGSVQGLGTRNLAAGAPPTPSQTELQAPEPAPDDEPPTAVEALESACYLGVLVPREAVDVVAETPGNLQQLALQVGDRVTRGQEVAVISSAEGRHRLREQSARLEAMHSSLRIAQAGTEHAQREMERRRAAPRLFSSEQIELATHQAELAELELERQRAALAEAEAVLSRVESTESRGRVRAPIDGTVSARYALPGTVVDAGQPLVRLISTARPLVRFAVPAGDVGELSSGSTVRIEVESGDLSAAAVVETVAPALDEASQLIFVEAGMVADQLSDVPAGTVARVGLADRDGCRDQPLSILPSS